MLTIHSVFFLPLKFPQRKEPKWTPPKVIYQLPRNFHKEKNQSGHHLLPYIIIYPDFRLKKLALG
jgi:hypothetical protein